MLENQYHEQLCNLTEYTLSCCIQPKNSNLKLLLKLTYLKNTMNVFLQTNINRVQNLGGLKYYCGNFYDVKEYLKNQENYFIDRENMVMVIFGKRFMMEEKLILTCLRFQPVQAVALGKKKELISNPQIVGEQIEEQKVKENLSNIHIQERFLNIEKSIKQLQEQNLRNKDQILKQIQIILNRQQQQKEKKILEHEKRKDDKIVQEIIKKTKIEQFKEHMSQLIQRIQQKSIMISEQNERKMEKFRDNFQIIEKQLNLKKPISAIDWVDHQCYAIQKNLLVFEQNKITSKGVTVFFGCKNIRQECSFFLKINKIQSFIGIGITNSEYKKQQKLTKTNINRFSYRSNRSFVFCANLNQNVGTGFKQGEIVEVNVDLSRGKIYWKVNSKISHQFQDDMIKQHINWVPYIFFHESQSVTVVNGYTLL